MTTTLSRVCLVTKMREVYLAQSEHIQAIAELEKATFTHPASENALGMFVENKDAFCVVLLEDGDLGSYCTVTTVLDEAQIINVATAERYKRQGCADAVISCVIDECKQRDIVSISLEVRESNAPAISLYEKFGFFVAGKRKNFYTDHRDNALVMIKNLD